MFAIRNTVLVFPLLVSLASCTNDDIAEFVVVECIQGDTIKYEFNFRHNKVLPDSVDSKVRSLEIPFPYSYGYTTLFKSQDGDYLDCFVLDSVAVKRGDTVSGNIRGVILMTDNGEEDCKLIISSDSKDLCNAVRRIEDFLHSYSQDEIKIFDFNAISNKNELEEVVKEFRNSKKI